MPTKTSRERRVNLSRVFLKASLKTIPLEREIPMTSSRAVTVRLTEVMTPGCRKEKVGRKGGIRTKIGTNKAEMITPAKRSDIAVGSSSALRRTAPTARALAPKHQVTTGMITAPDEAANNKNRAPYANVIWVAREGSIIE